LREMRDESPMRICAYSLMPNHWHLVLWPEHDGELHAALDDHPRAAMATAPGIRGAGACLPGSV